MSLPPPVLPPQVVARTRVKSLSSELAHEREPKLRAAIAYEIGALSESHLADRADALEHYRLAVSSDPTFRPALFALRRLLGDNRDDDELVRVLAKTANASDVPSERASSLIDLGCLLEDRLNDAAGARGAFERAVAADPRSPSALLMLERSLFAQNHSLEAQALVARRAALTSDPRLRSTLACEAANELADRGAIDEAIETLLSALALPGRQLATLFTLARLGERHDRPLIAARANEDLAALLASFAAGQTGPEAREIAARYPEAGRAAQAAAFLYREAARAYARAPGHARDSVLACERASACLPEDVLLHLERAAACEAADDLDGARASLLELAARAEPRQAAALQFQLAELAERQADPIEALARLRAARALAPEAAVVAAVLEDRLLDRADFSSLCDLLIERADRASAEDERRCALQRAALAADRAGDAARALQLYDRVVEQSPDETAALRELFGAALRFGDTTALRDAAMRLSRRDIDHAERSSMLRATYEAALREQDSAGALVLLRSALDEPACDAWAAHSAWVLSALHADNELLALAHEKLAELAERAEDDELAAAHLAAQSRALMRRGDHERAVIQLRRALELVPAHVYTVALLEESLFARGETAEAVHLLRASASEERDGQRGEAALLHAGAAAEQAGRLDLARSSYDQAAERDPLAFAPLWARLRFAERSDDRALRESSLIALAARERALDRPGPAQLELAEALIAHQQFDAALPPLTAALDHEATEFEAAAHAVLLPRGTAAERLRAQALSRLAEQSARPTRRALEHERTAELMHVAAADARLLLAAQAGSADPAGDALLAWLLCDDADQRAEAFERLAALGGDAGERAEFALHGQRIRAALGSSDDAEALVTALELLEAAPDSLAGALALDEALSTADDAEVRVTALRGLLAHLPPSAADPIRAALGRALLDAGQPGEATALAESLVTATPDDTSAWELLRVAARESEDFGAVVRACDALARACQGDDQARLLEEAAAVLHERLARLPEAEDRLRAALALLPARQPAFERLHDVLVERRDLDGLIALLAERTAVSSSLPERIDLIYERARILRGRGDRAAALSCIDELLALAPSHPGALSLSAEIHASREEFAAAVVSLRALAEAAIPPGQQRLAREGAADFLDDKLKNPHAAYLELRPLVSAGLADLTVHVRMADLAHRAGLMSQAADALMRAAEASRGPQRAAFERRAATLQSETLSQPMAAADSYRRALIAQPTDGESFEGLYGLSAAPERATLRDGFLESIWNSLAGEPSDPAALRALVRVGRAIDDALLIQIGLFALDALALANGEERNAADALRRSLAGVPSHELDDESFGLLAPLQLTAALARFARAGCAALHQLGEDTPERHGIDRRARRSREIAAGVREALQLWLDAFGLELSELYSSEREPRAIAAIEGAGRKHGFVVGRDVKAPFSRELRFELGQLMAAGRAGLLPLVREDASQARDVLAAALAAAGFALPPNLASHLVELRAQLDRRLPRALRRELEDGARALSREQGASLEASELPLRAIAGARTLALRAGLCASGDLGSALAALLGPQRPVTTVLDSKPALDLLRFWLSPRCVRVLRQLGGTA